MARDRNAISIREWADDIKDTLMHHIGEYYTLRYGHSWQKKDGTQTKSFQRWYLQQNTSAIEKIFLPEFEILRDKHMGFFVMRHPEDA